MFKPGQLYSIAALCGCIMFVALSQGYGWEDRRAALLAIAVTLLVRTAAIRFNWTTVAIRDWWRRKKE
jgi:uncharacterized membrane protein YeiH